MDQLFASPLKSLPAGVKYTPSPLKRPLSLSPERSTDGSAKKLFPIFERCTNRRNTPDKTDTPGRNRTRIRTPKSSAKKRLPLLKSTEQYAIDAGQRDFDATRCRTCNMLYTVGEVVDEATHAKYHDAFVNSVKFNGWKKCEDVVQHYEDGRVVRVTLECCRCQKKHSHQHRKIDDLFAVADLELGIRVKLEACINHKSNYLMFVTNDKHVAGFVAAEGISKACQLISEEPLMASTEEVPAECGVARLWTHHKYRRQKIATRLLDILRVTFIPGRVIAREKLAFSDPTNNGLEFAKKYTGTKNFFIFQLQTAG